MYQPVLTTRSETGPSTVEAGCRLHLSSGSCLLAAAPRAGEYFHMATCPAPVPPASTPIEANHRGHSQSSRMVAMIYLIIYPKSHIQQDTLVPRSILSQINSGAYV